MTIPLLSLYVVLCHTECCGSDVLTCLPMPGYLTDCRFIFITSFNPQPPWKVGVAMTILCLRKLRSMEENRLSHITQPARKQQSPVSLAPKPIFIHNTGLHIKSIWRLRTCQGHRWQSKAWVAVGIQTSGIMRTQETEIAGRRQAATTDQGRELTGYPESPTPDSHIRVRACETMGPPESETLWAAGLLISLTGRNARMKMLGNVRVHLKV